MHARILPCEWRRTLHAAQRSGVVRRGHACQRTAALLRRGGWVGGDWLRLEVALGGGELGQVHNTLAVAPLVVVPGDNLDEVVTQDHGEGGVDGGGHIAAPEVHGHQGLVHHCQETLGGAAGSLTEGLVHLLGEGLLLNLEDQVDDRHVGGGDTQGNTIELALQLGQHQGDGLGGAGGGGHDVEGGCAGAAQVAVRGVQQALVPGVGVGGGHHRLDDAEPLVQHLYEGGQAVGGAGGVGHDGGVGVEGALVDTHHVGGDVVTLGGGSDQHLLGTSLNVLAGALGVDEDTGALDDDVDAQLLPRQLQGVAAGHDADVLAVHRQRVVVHDLHIRVEGTQGTVVLQQVAGLLDTAGVVDGNDVQERRLTAVPAPQEVAANATEAVDGNLLGGVALHAGLRAAGRAASGRDPQRGALHGRGLVLGCLHGHGADRAGAGHHGGLHGC
mmetsp:Transcript_19258/g.58140  ORF Transcript_19258/g.58140 Transcript_19258/m.58140 type:complete len:442 (-) Transcript_19258:83-1408(-)